MTDIPYRIKPDTLIVQASPGVSATMGEHLIMLNVERGSYFDMNPTAKLIWESLTTPCTINDLCAIIHEEYEVSDHSCRESVEHFILELQKENMVSFPEASSTTLKKATTQS